MFLFSTNTYSQLNEKKRANFWHFGNNAGMDFSNCFPVSFAGSQLASNEGSASISDINGNLLFYTNGETVWDKNNNIMPNGTGLLGDVSTVQSAIIVPHPANTDHYYIFTAGTSIEDQGVIGVRFSEVDLTLNGGNGDVLIPNKNTLLFDPNEEKLTAVINSTFDGYWVTAQEKSSNKWYTYAVTATGVNMVPVISITGPPARIDNSLGAKFSPDGTMLVTQNVCGVGASSNANLTLYSFDNATGVINYLWSDCGTPGFNLEFSPDCSKLYAAGSQMYQYDLTAGANISDSVAIIASKTQLTSSNWTVDALQLANDCQIYVAEGGTTIGEIQNPNAAGLACNYVPGAFTLTSGTTGQRFPNFVQSFFDAPCTNLDITLTGTDANCINDGTASIVINQGTAPFSYVWSNGKTTQNIINLGGGIYTVTVSDASGCSITDSVFVGQPQTVIIDNSAITNTSTCASADGAIDITTLISGFGTLDTLLMDGFETDGQTTRYIANPYPGNASTSFFFMRGDDATINFSNNPTNEEGSFYFGARRTGFSTIPTTCDVTFNPANIAGYTNLEMCAYLALGKTNMSVDANTRITLEYNIDGSGWNTLMDFRQGLANPFPVNNLYEDTDGDGVGDGAALTTAFQDFCYPIPGTGNNIELRVTTNASGSSLRQTAFDFVRLKGAPPFTYSYLWSTGATTQDVSNLSAGNYWVQITGSNGGCVVTDTFTVASPCTTPVLEASFNLSAATVCEGDSITFTDNSTGNNIFNWIWAFNGGTPSSANTQGAHTVSFNSSGNYNITLQITDSSGTDDTTIAITVLAPSVSTASASICQGDSILLAGAFQTLAGTYNDTILNGSANGCDSLVATTLTITPKDNAGFNYPAASYCLTDPNPTATISGTTGGTFTIDNGGTINPTTGELDIATSGVGNFSITYTTSGSCPDDSTFNISISNGFDATITLVGPFCAGDAAINMVAVDPNGIWSGTGITNTTTGTFDPVIAGAGTHEIIYTISGSCGDADTVDVVVNPIATSTASASICQGDSILLAGAFQTLAGTYNDTILNGSANGCDSLVATTLTITPKDNAGFNYPAASYCLTDPNPTATISGTTGGTFTIDNGGTINPTTGELDIATSGVGNFNITYTTSGSCPDDSTFNISITNQQNATITPVALLCAGDAAINMVAVDPNGIWSGTGITNTTTGTFDPVIAGAGTHEIIYTISGSCGDADTVNIKVSASPTLTLQITDDNCFSEEGSIVCLVNGGISPYSYSWDNGGISPSITNLSAGIYTLTVNDSIGCSSSISGSVNDVSLDCDYHVFLPNIFSPNGDGQNDVFIVRGKGVESINLIVYSRWGEKVFESNNLNNGWDGTFKGKKMNPAVFVYYLTAKMLNNTTIEKQGNVTLVK